MASSETETAMPTRPDDLDLEPSAKFFFRHDACHRNPTKSTKFYLKPQPRLTKPTLYLSLFFTALASLFVAADGESLEQVSRAYEESLTAIKSYKLDQLTANYDLQVRDSCGPRLPSASFCSLEKNILILQRYELTKTQLLATALAACERFHHAISTDLDFGPETCDRYCKKSKCLHDIDMTIKGYINNYQELVRETCFDSRLKAVKTSLNSKRKRKTQSHMVLHKAKVLYPQTSKKSSRRISNLNRGQRRRAQLKRRKRRLRSRSAGRKVTTSTRNTKRRTQGRRVFKSKTASRKIRPTNKYHSKKSRRSKRKTTSLIRRLSARSVDSGPTFSLHQQIRDKMQNTFSTCDVHGQPMSGEAALDDDVILKLVDNPRKQLHMSKKGNLQVKNDSSARKPTKWIFEFYRNYQLRLKQRRPEICKERYESDRLREFEGRSVTSRLVCDTQGPGTGSDGISRLQVFCSSYRDPRKVYIGYEVDSALALSSKKFAHVSLYGKMLKTPTSKVKHGFGSLTTEGFKPIELLLPESYAGKCSDLFLQYYQH